MWNGIMVDFTVSMKSILVFPISYYDFDSWCRLLASSIHAGSVTGASSQLTRRLTVTRQLYFHRHVTSKRRVCSYSTRSLAQPLRSQLYRANFPFLFPPRLFLHLPEHLVFLVEFVFALSSDKASAFQGMQQAPPPITRTSRRPRSIPREDLVSAFL
jgi:hypothetical protein